MLPFPFSLGWGRRMPCTASSSPGSFQAKVSASVRTAGRRLMGNRYSFPKLDSPVPWCTQDWFWTPAFTKIHTYSSLPEPTYRKSPSLIYVVVHLGYCIFNECLVADVELMLMEEGRLYLFKTICVLSGPTQSKPVLFRDQLSFTSLVFPSVDFLIESSEAPRGLCGG